MDLKSSEQKRPEKTLPSGWEARLGLNGRVYYLSHRSHTVQILPPHDAWSCVYGLSYGWELAFDYEDKSYFINHVLQQVTYTDPRNDDDMSYGDGSGPSNGPLPPHPREYTIIRDEKLGYGFIAGSEKPVIVRSVTPGGPTENMLLPGDQIIKIGDEYVASVPREHVIDLIKDSKESVTLTVIQPAVIANSSFLKPSKKLLKGMNRHRVRFAEISDENQEATDGNSLLIAPNVLRVYLEEGQNRSFEFHTDTTAGDIVALLCEELKIEDHTFYSLVLRAEKTKNRGKEHKATKLSDDIFVPPWELMSKVLSNPSIKHHKCRFRMAFVAKDVHKLSREDPNSFNYFYQQCVNDVVEGEIFRNDLSVEETMRLASIHMLLKCLQQEEGSSSSHPTRKSSKKKSLYPLSKFNLKLIEKEFGLEKFLPQLLSDQVSNQSKEHRKTLQQCIKTSYNNYIVNGGGNGTNNNNKTSPPQSPSMHSGAISVETLLPQLRMQYIKSLSHFHLYGGRYFEATILAVVESDITLLVGHHYGISQLIDNKNKMASIFSDFSALKLVEVAPHQPGSSKTNVKVEFQDMAPLVVSMQPQSAIDFANMISGYCRVHGNNDMMLTLPIPESMTAPEYFGPHRVKPSNWNYPVDADPSSTFHCDFSEPLHFSLLSDQIPESVRAMFQQSLIVENLEEVHDEDVEVLEAPRESDSSESEEESHSPMDEGVAMVTVDVSPKSSTSSMMSGSPSSGIGSSPVNRSRWEQIDSTSSENRQQLRISNSSSEGAPTMEVYINQVPNYQEEDGPPESIENDNMEENAVENAKDSDSGSSVSVDIVTNITLRTKDIGSDTSSATSLEKTEIHKTKQKEDSTPAKPASTKKAPAPPVPAQGLRFSSFKPDEKAPSEASSAPKSDDTPSTSSRHDHSSDVIAGDVISSHEFQARLSKANVAAELPPAHLEGDTVEIATSPLPVDDLARGHKSLKGEKKKNRFSWGGSLPRSKSSDAETENTKKRKSLLRGIFSTRRAYSMEKEKRKSSFSLEEEPEKKKKWRFLGIFRSSSSSSSKKKSRFSLFRRKKRSHDLNVSASPHFSQGAYTTYKGNRTFEMDSVKQAASLEDITRRDKEQIQTKPRPVSFMTFQHPPSDEEESDGSETPNPQRKVTPDASFEETTAPLPQVQPRTEPINVAPPVVPPRGYSSSSSEDEEQQPDTYVVVHEPRVSNTPDESTGNDYESLEEVTRDPASPSPLKVKRKAPPPPPLPPSLHRKSEEEASTDQGDVYENPDEIELNAHCDFYEVPDSEAIYEDVEVPKITISKDEENVTMTKKDSVSSQLSSGMEHSLEKVKLTPSSTSSSDDESEVAVESHEVQVIQDDFSSSFPSLKASTDDLTTQIFSVLDNRNSNLNQEEERRNEIEEDEKSTSSSSSEEQKELHTEPPLTEKGAVIASDVDAVLKDIERASISDSSDKSSSDEEPLDFEKNLNKEQEIVIAECHAVREDAEQHDFTPNNVSHMKEDTELQIPPVEEIDGGMYVHYSETDSRSSEDEREENAVDFTPASEQPLRKIDFEPDESENDEVVDEPHVIEKPDRIATVLNRLLLNGLDDEEWKENGVVSSTELANSSHEEEHHFFPQKISSSSSSESSSEEEAFPNTTKSSDHFDNPPPKVEIHKASAAIEVHRLPPTDVTKIEPVMEPTSSELPTFIPPPAEFNVPAIQENQTDVEKTFKYRESSPERSENGHVVTLNHDTSPQISSPSFTNQNSATSKLSPPPNSTGSSYHNLITPRFFGQKQQLKPFAKVKPPTLNKTSPRPVTSSVLYPGATKNGHPGLNSKPTMLQQSPS